MRLERLWTICRWAAAIALLAWVGTRLPWPGARPGAWPHGLDWPWGVASLAGLAAAIALGGLGWQRWVLATGASLSYGQAFRILYLANLAKYLPGAGWHFAGRLVLAREAGVDPLLASAALALDVVGHFAGAVCFALACGLATGQLPAAGAVLVGLGLALGLHPALLQPALRWAARLLRREPPTLRLTYAGTLAQVMLYTVDWCAIGAGFALLARMFGPYAPDQAAAIAGALALAWIAGALALFAPAGLGVRETALVALLATSLPPAQAAELAVTSRAWFMVGELLAFGAASAVKAPR